MREHMTYTKFSMAVALFILLTSCGSKDAATSQQTNTQNDAVDTATAQLIGTIDAQAALTSELLNGGRTQFTQTECAQWWEYHVRMNDEVQRLKEMLVDSEDLEVIKHYCDLWNDAFVATTIDASKVITSNSKGWKALVKQASTSDAAYKNVLSNTGVAGSEIESIQMVCFNFGFAQ